jgi:hypothetical protein
MGDDARRTRAVRRGAVAGALRLFGGLLLGGGIMGLLEGLAPPGLWRDVASAVALLLCSTLDAAGYGGALAHIAGLEQQRARMARAAMVFGPLVLIVGLVLGLGEATAAAAIHIPIAALYTLLFVPATFLVTAGLGAAIGSGSGQPGAARALGLEGGGAAALAFLAADLLQHLLGRRVGGPHAAETATMVSVTLVALLFAAMAAGAVMGRALARVRVRPPASD